MLQNWPFSDPRWFTAAPKAALPLTLILMLLCSAPVAAQDESSDEPRRNSLRARAVAVEFEVDPRLGGPAGSATLSAKYHLSAPSAFRLGFLIQVSTEDDASEARSVVDTLVLPGGVLRSDEDRQTYRLFAHFLRYAAVGSRLAVFGFVGPTVHRSWSRILSQSRYGDDANNSLTTRLDSRSRGIGADLGAGFEYFFSRRISMGGRYGLVYLYQDSNSHRVFTNRSGSYTQSNFEDTYSHGFVIQSNPTVIMLSAYF